MSKMKAVAIREFGGPAGLAVVELPLPRAAAGHVRIAVEAIGVGSADVLIRSGALAAYGFQPGFLLGAEAVGTVDEVGEGVDRSWLGQRVFANFGADVGGAYAEFVVADASSIVAVPAALSSARAIPLANAVVAHYALQRLALHPGDRLLVRGAGGGIGLMATQFAASSGLVVAATTSSPERGARLRTYGVTEVLDRSAAGAEPFHAILDIVAGPDLPSFFPKLAPGGHHLLVGMVGGPPPADFGLSLFAAFQRSLVFSTLSLNIIPPAERRAALLALMERAAGGALEPVLHAVLPLEAAAEAHALLESGAVFGKLVLAPRVR